MSHGLPGDPPRAEVREDVALEAPAASWADPASLEFLRAWVSGERVAVQLREELWVDPAAWGVALVDIAVAAARTYGRKGLPTELALERMRQGLDAEWEVASTGWESTPAPLVTPVAKRPGRSRRRQLRRRAPAPRGGR